MKRILVPTDFSSTAEKAFRFAVNIAARANRRFFLNHDFISVTSTFGTYWYCFYSLYILKYYNSFLPPAFNHRTNSL